MMLWKLLSGMDRDAFVPLVISLIPLEPMAERIAALGIRVESLQMRRGLPSPGALITLVRLLRQFKPDLIQTWMYHADLLGALARPLVAFSAHRPRLVWNIRQTDLDPRLTSQATRLVARLNGHISRLAPDRIICCSESAREVHRTLGYRGAILNVIPNGFDLVHFRPDPEHRADLRMQLGLSANCPLIGLVARFDPQKDLPNFLGAAALVLATRSECQFLICGRGMDSSSPVLGEWIRNAGLGNAIHLLGPRSDTPMVFAALDILVSSSAYGEGFPNVIGEAMACGVPCVVTDVGDSGLIVDDTGITVPPRDSNALAAAILGLLDEGPDALARRGSAARARIASKYALPRIIKRYAELYQSL